LANGIKTGVQWGASKVTQPTSGLRNLDNLPTSYLEASPDRNKKLEEPALA
jgi:1-phosphofructokinase